MWPFKPNLDIEKILHGMIVDIDGEKGETFKKNIELLVKNKRSSIPQLIQTLMSYKTDAMAMVPFAQAAANVLVYLSFDQRSQQLVFDGLISALYKDDKRGNFKVLPSMVFTRIGKLAVPCLLKEQNSKRAKANKDVSETISWLLSRIK